MNYRPAYTVTWHISANLRHPGKPSPPSPLHPLSWLRGSQMKRDLADQIKCSAVSHTQIPLSPSSSQPFTVSSSLNTLKCLPLPLQTSEKWWICNYDWLWRLVKNSLFLSHPPAKRVHFFPLTVSCLLSYLTLSSKSPPMEGGPSVPCLSLFSIPLWQSTCLSHFMYR